MNMHTPISFLRTIPVVLLLTLGLLTGCDSNDPSGDVNDQEVISEVTITLTNAADANDVVSAQSTFDAAGVLQSSSRLDLTPGVTYNGSIEFRNGLTDDPDEEDITEEVREEAAEHQVFYELNGLSGVTVTVTDQESDYGSEDEFRNGVPVGLAFDVVVDASASGTGTMLVVLGHYDERPKGTNETVDATPERDIDFEQPVAVN